MALKPNQIVYIVTDYKGIFIARKAVVKIALSLNVKVECEKKIVIVKSYCCFVSEENALNFAIALNVERRAKMSRELDLLSRRVEKLDQFIKDQTREVLQLNATKS